MLKLKIPSDKKEYEEFKNSLLDYIDCKDCLDVIRKVGLVETFTIATDEFETDWIFCSTTTELKLSLFEGKDKEKQKYPLKFSIDTSKELKEQYCLDLLHIAVLLGFKGFQVEYN